MVKLSDYRGGSTLKCADLGRKEHLVQIESVSVEEVGEERERKLVARFEGKAKGLALNDTNLEAIEEAFGPNSDDAIGGQVILYVDPEVRFGGQRVGGIRIKLPKGPVTSASSSPAMSAKANAKGKAAPKEESTAELLNDDIPSDW